MIWHAWAVLESGIHTYRVPIIKIAKDVNDDVIVGWEAYKTFNEDYYFNHNLETCFDTKKEAQEYLKKYTKYDCEKCSKKIVEKIKIGTLPTGGLWWNRFREGEE